MLRQPDDAEAISWLTDQIGDLDDHPRDVTPRGDIEADDALDSFSDVVIPALGCLLYVAGGFFTLTYYVLISLSLGEFGPHAEWSPAYWNALRVILSQSDSSGLNTGVGLFGWLAALAFGAFLCLRDEVRIRWGRPRLTIRRLMVVILAAALFLAYPPLGILALIMVPVVAAFPRFLRGLIPLLSQHRPRSDSNRPLDMEEIMSTAAPPAPMTLEAMLALPEDGMERDLIDGQLRERPMTRRNRWHSRSTVRLALLLEQWLERQPEPRGEIVGGEAGFRLRRDPDTGVGIDIAYVSAAVIANTPESAAYFEGPPVLAVEILSPSDNQEAIAEKVRLYLTTGVALVWLVDPEFRTVLVYRPDAEPALFNRTQELSGEPHLPGFRVPVARIFEI